MRPRVQCGLLLVVRKKKKVFDVSLFLIFWCRVKVVKVDFKIEDIRELAFLGTLICVETARSYTLKNNVHTNARDTKLANLQSS